MPDVMLLRSPDEQEPDRYLDAFHRADLEAACEPVLQFHYPRQDVLHLRLSQRDQYGGLLVTSSRALDAVGAVFEDDETVQQMWTMARTYTVGPRTAQHARDLGLHPRGEDTGDAADLLSVVTEDSPSRPLLFLSGDRRRDTVPNGLFEAGIDFNELEVYRTDLRSNLTVDGTTNWLAFFSPSGIEAVQKNGVDPGAYRLAAIGDTTAAALEEAGYTVAAVAEAPSPEALVRAITTAA